jgi:nucleotide-binding universal stress UspA family protein
MQPQIWVPLDGSALAETGLPHAALLARTTGSTIVLFQVVLPPVLISPMLGAVPTPTLDFGTEEAAIAAAQAYLAGVAGPLEAQGQPVQTAVTVGDPATAIVAWAAHDPSGRRIAMVTHGRSGLERWLLGSVAAKVLQSAPTPVLLVRAPAPPPAQPYRMIMVPPDGSPLAERALTAGLPLAQASGATLLLLTVAPPLEANTGAEGATELSWAVAPPAAVTADLERYLAEVARDQVPGTIPVQTRVITGHPAEGILQASDAMEADLIVMATHGRGGLQRLWLGSVAWKVVQHARRPVLLIRA